MAEPQIFSTPPSIASGTRSLAAPRIPRSTWFGSSRIRRGTPVRLPPEPGVPQLLRGDRPVRARHRGDASLPGVALEQGLIVMTGNSPASSRRRLRRREVRRSSTSARGESPHDSPWTSGATTRRRSSSATTDLTTTGTATSPTASARRGWRTSGELPRRASPRMPFCTSGTAVRSGPRCGIGRAGVGRLFVEAVSNADWSDPGRAKAAIVGRMKEYEPSDELQFLMELSIEPVAAGLGLLTTTA